MSATRDQEPTSFASTYQWLKSSYYSTTSWVSKKLSSSTAKTIYQKMSAASSAAIPAYGSYFIFELIGLAVTGTGGAYIGLKVAQYTTTTATFLFYFSPYSQKNNSLSNVNSQIKLLAATLTTIDKKFGNAIRIRKEVEALTKQAGYTIFAEEAPDLLLDDSSSLTISHELNHSKKFIAAKSLANGSAIAAIFYNLFSNSSSNLQWSATIISFLISTLREYRLNQEEAAAEKDLKNLKLRTAAGVEKLAIIKECLLGTREELLEIIKTLTNATTDSILHVSSIMNGKKPKPTCGSLEKIVSITLNGASLGGTAYNFFSVAFPSVASLSYIASGITWTLGSILEKQKIINTDNFYQEMYLLNQIAKEADQVLMLAERILTWQQTYVKTHLSDKAAQILTEAEDSKQEEDANRLLAVSVDNLDLTYDDALIESNFNLTLESEPEVSPDAAPVGVIGKLGLFASKIFGQRKNSLEESLLDNTFQV